MATNTISGPRCIFRFNDKVVAYAGGIDGSEEYMYEAVDVLDRLEVAEYVPVGYRVSFNCAIFRTLPNVPSTGPVSTAGPNKPAEGQLGSLKAPAVGIMPRSTGSPSEILTNGYMSASITDRLSKVAMYRFQEVKAVSNNFSITARGIVSQNCSFNAIRLLDEAES